MTGPGDSGPVAPGEPEHADLEPADLEPAEPEPMELEPSELEPGAGPARPGLRTFSLDGRHAAGLYLVGWLASLLGSATILVVLLAQSSDVAGAILLGVGTFLLSIGLGAAAGSQAIERQAAGVHAYRGPSPFLLFGATIALTLFLEVLALAPLDALNIPAGSTGEALVGLLILNGSAVGLVALFVVGSGALSWQEMGVPVRTAAGWRIPHVVRDLVVGMALAVPILFLTAILASVLVSLLGVTPPGPLPPPRLPPMRSSTSSRACSSRRSGRSCSIAASPRRHGFGAWVFGAGSCAAHCFLPWPTC